MFNCDRRTTVKLNRYEKGKCIRQEVNIQSKTQNPGELRAALKLTITERYKIYLTINERLIMFNGDRQTVVK